MNYLNLISKHELRIANHRVRNDALSAMNMPHNLPGIAPSKTLQELYDMHQEPLFFLRKETYGWRLRLIEGSKSRTVTWQKTPWYTLEKISIVISNETYHWDNALKQYTRKKRNEFDIGISISINKKLFNSFMEKYLELNDFIVKFIETYDKCEKEFKEQIKLRKAA